MTYFDLKNQTNHDVEMVKIYLTRQRRPIAEELLSSHFEVDENPHDRVLSREELKRVVRGFDGFLSTLPDHLDKEILEPARGLKVIFNCAAVDMAWEAVLRMDEMRFFHDQS